MSDKHFTEINSPQNARVKNVVRLRDGRHRRKQGRFVIDGIRELSRARRGGIVIDEVFFCRELCSEEQQRRLDEVLAGFQKGTDSEGACPLSQPRPLFQPELIAVSQNAFRKMAFGDRAEGVLAVARTPNWKLDDLQLPRNPVGAVIDGIEKPGNIGAVIRSADAAAVDAAILPAAAPICSTPTQSAPA